MPLNIDLQQICLHLFNFGLLFGGLYFLVYNPVKKFMASREKAYQDRADESEANLKSSEETKALYEEKLAASDAEIQEMKEQARLEINKTTEKRLSAASEEAASILQKAKEERLEAKHGSNISET